MIWFGSGRRDSSSRSHAGQQLVVVAAQVVDVVEAHVLLGQAADVRPDPVDLGGVSGSSTGGAASVAVACTDSGASVGSSPEDLLNHGMAPTLATAGFARPAFRGYGAVESRRPDADVRAQS